MITLTTDFGDCLYVAAVKGVLCSISPGSRIVDLCHSIEPQNLYEAAYVLCSAAPHFPDGTVHLCVVDPGVGTDRKALLFECEHGYLVGPDNGSLHPAGERLGIKKVYQLETPEGASGTFHARDVFAPAAARLDMGVKPSELGTPLSQWERMDLAWYRREGRCLTARVLYVDYFGNTVTSVPWSALEGVEVLELDGRVFTRVST